MGGWLKIGSKKIGIEFGFLAMSAIALVSTHYFVIGPQDSSGWMLTVYFLVFAYNAVTYLFLAFSDPGRVDGDYVKE